MLKIHEFLNRVRDWATFYKKELIFGLIIFLTATISFGLGYLANRELNHAPIIIEKAGE